MPRVVALVPDLMDRSRISAALGSEVELVATPGHLRQRLGLRGPNAEPGADPDAAPSAGGPEIIVVDLGRRGVLDALPGIRAATSARIIGFGPHVERDLLTAARQAGCDEVVARSAFFATLDRLLAD